MNESRVKGFHYDISLNAYFQSVCFERRSLQNFKQRRCVKKRTVGWHSSIRSRMNKVAAYLVKYTLVFLIRLDSRGETQRGRY